MFCRVRPLLQDRSETKMVVTYPTSIEMLGRGIELEQNGITHISLPLLHSYCFLRVSCNAMLCLVKYHNFVL